MANTADPDWLRAQYSSGRPLAAIAADAGISLSTLHKTLHRHGIPPRHPRRRLEERAAREALSTQPTVVAAARILDVNVQSLHEWARDHGLRPYPSAGPGDLCQRYQAGETTTSLAAQEGVSPRTVNRWLRAQGVQLRSPGRRPTL